MQKSFPLLGNFGSRIVGCQVLFVDVLHLLLFMLPQPMGSVHSTLAAHHLGSLKYQPYQPAMTMSGLHNIGRMDGY